MCSLTPNASWMTITAPLGSPSGAASYSSIGPSGVASSSVRVVALMGGSVRSALTARGSMMGRLEGKVAVITGASSGIGGATATRFAAEGASIAGLDLAPPAEDHRAELQE